MIKRKDTIAIVTLCLPLIIIIGLTLKEYSMQMYNNNGIRNLTEIVKHKDLFPMDSSDIWGTIFVGLGLLVAASGGVGGGGILVPLLIGVYGFHPKYAIPLSNFTIVGSSITNMIMNLVKRHPDADRPLVDWDLIVVMEPLTMAGAIVGAFIGKLLPDIILVTSLVALLAYTTHGTLQKAFSQYAKETKELENASKSLLAQANDKEIEMVEEAESQGLLANEDNEELETKNDEKDLSSLSLNERKLREILEAEKSTPIFEVQVMSAMIGIVITLNLVKGGGHKFPSPIGIVCGSNTYWMVTLATFVMIVGVSLWMRERLIAKWRLKAEVGYKYIKGDIEWTERNTIVFPCICFFAGFFAGMFGIGGGIVKGPLMLQMGVHPLVAAGTVAVMIMFTSLAATTMFMAFGTLTFDYGIFLFIIGLICTSVGQYGVSYLVDKYKRYSFISFSIGAVVAISTVLMTVQSIMTFVDNQEKGAPKDSNICN
jgi:uncharacterized membrane protein YfcA